MNRFVSVKVYGGCRVPRCTSDLCSLEARREGATGDRRNSGIVRKRGCSESTARRSGSGCPLGEPDAPPFLRSVGCARLGSAFVFRFAGRCSTRGCARRVWGSDGRIVRKGRFAGGLGARRIGAGLFTAAGERCRPRSDWRKSYRLKRRIRALFGLS